MERSVMTTTWFSYSEIDSFEHKIRNFADLSLNDSPVMSCENEELEDESDNTMKVHDEGMKRKGRGPTMCHDVHALEDGKKICVECDDLGQPRKYDIPNKDLYRSWVMKDLSFKWKFHKYDLRRKYLKEDKKGIQIKPTSRYHINKDMWREAVKVWTSSAFRKEKTGTDPDRADVFIITHTRKDGRPINEDCAIATEKFKALKQTQPSTNSSNPVVAKDDAFFKMTGKKVKLLDLENEQVAEGIVISIDPKKIVMGRPIGHAYCEVSINYENKPDAPLFVKDDHRFRIKDAIGSHILWIRDYVLVDEAKRSLFSV
ncbi:hypothetical protein Taro_025687, partial [Colocasia esculenta]|nr:hypothetical protein [Colocasia esculenta]